MTVKIPREGDWGTASQVIAPGAGGSWDVRLYGMKSPCCVAKLGSTYYVYYIGADGDRGDGGPANRALGVASGTDPSSLTKSSSNPIITFSPNGDNEEGIYSAACIVENGTIHLWYGALRGSGGSVDIEVRYAKSTDGETFTDDTLVHQVASEEDTPIGAFIDGSGNYNVYYFNNLSGGSGEIRRLSGSTPTNLTDAGLLTSTQYQGGGDVNFLDDDTMMVGLTPGTLQGDIHKIKVGSPDALSARQEVYSDGYEQRALYLDEDAGKWLQYLNTDLSGDNQIDFQEATVDTTPAGMPVLTTVGEDSAANATTLDISVTILNETDDALLASIPFADGSGSTATISSVVLDPGGANEANFTFKDANTADASLYMRTEAWRLFDPPAGTFTVRITASEELARLFGEVSQAVTVDQTDPFGSTVAKNDGSSTSASVTLTTSEDNSVVLGIAYHGDGDTDITPGTDVVELMDRVQTGVNGWAGYKEAPSAGSTTVDFTTDGSSDWAMIGLEVLGIPAETGDLNVRVWRANPEHTSPEVEVA